VALQGARGARGKQPAEAEERSGDADCAGPNRRGGRPLRVAGAAREPGARDGRGGKAREAMGAGKVWGALDSGFFQPPVAIGDAKRRE
jgi:hypothetical protein